jgi:4-amino-4-deoxy-L-arabinose transferase-like glycosyltransferase
MEGRMLKKERLFLTVLVLLAAALGVRWVAMLQDEVVANDATLYIKSAKLYSMGAYTEGFDAFPRSTFPLFIAFAQRFIGDWIRAGQWVSAFFGTLAVIPLFLLARRIFNERIAVVSSIFYIICPSLVQNSAEVLRDTPFIFFYITALWLGYEGVREKQAGIMGLAGVIILLCASLKDYGLMVFGAILLFLCWSVIKKQIIVGKALILCSTFLATSIVILILSGMVLDYRKFGIHIPAITRARITLASVADQRSRVSKLEEEIEESELSPQGKRFFDLALEHRMALYFFRIFSKTLRAFNIVFFGLFILGLVKRRIVPYRLDEFLLFTIYITFIPLFFLILIASAYLQTKNTFPLLVPSLIWSGVGFEEFVGKIKTWVQKYSFPSKEWNLRHIGLLIIVLITIAMLLMGLRPQRKDKLDLKEIGSWLKNNGYANSMILGRAELMRLAFYADSEFIPIPKGSYENIIKFARERKARLLVIDKEVMDRLSPNFLDKVTTRDLQPIDITGIKTYKYTILVFRIIE